MIATVTAVGQSLAQFSQTPLFEIYVFFTVLSFAWGACIGSFLNVCIYRIPLELSVVKPRSFCPSCKTPIAWYHNLPIVTWLMLRGRCRYCGCKITPRYVLVEFLVAMLFVLMWLKLDFFGFRPGAALHLAIVTNGKLVPVYWLIVSGLVLGTFVDFEHMIIPDRVTLGGIAAGLILSTLVPSLHGVTHAWTGLLWSAIGAAGGWALLWGVAELGRLIFRKDAMGFGDVKLIGAIGAFLGWRAVLFTVVASSLVGSIVGIALVAARNKEMQSRIPYGPYLALGAVLWLLWGPALWDWYAGLCTMAPPPPMPVL